MTCVCVLRQRGDPSQPTQGALHYGTPGASIPGLNMKPWEQHPLQTMSTFTLGQLSCEWSDRAASLLHTHSGTTTHCTTKPFDTRTENIQGSSQPPEAAETEICQSICENQVFVPQFTAIELLLTKLDTI